MVEIVAYSFMGVGLVGTVFTIGYKISNDSKAKNYVTKTDCETCNKDINTSLKGIHKEMNLIAQDTSWIKGKMEGFKK